MADEPAPPLRACRTCAVEKPPDEFYRRSDGRPDLHCRDCVRARVGAHGLISRRSNGMSPRWRRVAVVIGGVECQQCSGCRVLRQVTEFYPAGEGLFAECKPCILSRRKNAYRSRNEQRRRQGLDRDRRRSWMLAYRARAHVLAAVARASEPERFREYGRARKARIRGAPVSDLTVGQWTQILDAYGHRCGYCGSVEGISQDHLVPLVRGGNHTANNVVPACQSCNSRKRTRTPEEWEAVGGPALDREPHPFL